MKQAEKPGPLKGNDGVLSKVSEMEVGDWN